MQQVEKHPSLTEQATTQIRAGILDGSLEVGQVYSAVELGKKLGVSRTPIREALLELERRGLVRIEKNRGARILSTSIDTLIEVFQIRLMIEVPLSRRTAEFATTQELSQIEESFERFREQAQAGNTDGTLKADRDFHSTLLSGASNQKALQLLREQRDFVLSTGIGTVPKSRSALDCFHDHDDIMEALRVRDIGGVGAAVGRHISNTAQILIAQESGSLDHSSQLRIRKSLNWYIH